jgi:hypothetical protein
MGFLIRVVLLNSNFASYMKQNAKAAATNKDSAIKRAAGMKLALLFLLSAWQGKTTASAKSCCQRRTIAP